MSTWWNRATLLSVDVSPWVPAPRSISRAVGRDISQATVGYTLADGERTEFAFYTDDVDADGNNYYEHFLDLIATYKDEPDTLLWFVKRSGAIMIEFENLCNPRTSHAAAA